VRSAVFYRARSAGLPTDVESIAKEHNIQVRYEPLEDSVAGMLIVKDDYGVISVNAGHHPNRRRFTIAHELGHYLLHCNSSTVFLNTGSIFFRDERSSTSDEQEEIEANEFAVSLLMPEEILTSRFRSEPVDIHDDVGMRLLAMQFGVSVQALTIGLTRLRLILA
jgi:Zn-dependent peptidase ImmA (M78 family)